jgi:diguanylate cyclase (GGDEF)-like protein
MVAVPESSGFEDAGWMLALNQRGMGALQELLAVLRESDHGVLTLLQRNRHLAHYAWSDPLTGLLNRRGLDEQLAREEARAQRYGLPVTVVLLDVRGLKAVNDQHGHLAGDALLRAVAGALRASVRGTDVAARFGGDEFAAVLSGTEHSGGEAFVERVRAAAHPVRLPDGATVPIRFAAGIACRDETGTLPDALTLADERLVESKRT